MTATSTDREQARIEAVAAALADFGAAEARVALVLGSGLGGFAERLDGARAFDYGAVPHLPSSKVAGHAGRFVLGDCAGVTVLVQQGRAHLYEGHDPRAVVRAVRAMARVGVRGLVLTNAAGGLRREWTPPTLVRITDHVNLQGTSPLLAGEGGERVVHDPLLGAALEEAATVAGFELARGVYVANLGPAYETPAEVELARRLGGDLVGMSTALEATAAHAAGLRVCAVSCVTNHAAGVTGEPLSHDEVIAAGRLATERFEALLTAAIPRLAAAVCGADGA